MKTGYYELDNIINLNKPQLIVCSSADCVIESFFTNVLRNISVDQKIPALYIDNNLMRDCTENIKKEIYDKDVKENEKNISITGNV